MARNWYSDLEQNPYNKLHREYDGIAMIDVDSVEVCPHCTEPLAFIEHAKDVGQKFKTTTIRSTSTTTRNRRGSKRIRKSLQRRT